MKDKRFYLFSTFLWLTIFSAPVLSNDKSYLDALEAEAEDSSTSQKVVQPAATTAPQTPSDEDSRMQTIQRKIEFTNKLSNELPATTRAFYKLNELQKKDVIDTYFDNNHNMSKATQLLFNLYFKNKTSN